MRPIATFVLTWLALTAALAAQPQVSYIIPDIGAAGMNTYIEIIAPPSAGGTFGADGLKLNAPTDAVRVEPATALDAAKIVVGPLVVSWNGRLISTQIFVKPDATPGTVQIKVTNASGSVNVDFDIVVPQNLGTLGILTTTGALGSGGAFGTRSKRGAMIVNDLTLQGTTFTVSTTDTDPTKAGNQGYLPFILLVKGKLTLNGNVSVSAPGVDAGPGGGGGGGQVCDAAIFGGGSSGGNGGAGFTGGGSGGKNNSFGSHTYNQSGVSTGAPVPSGSPSVSLNGALGGDSPNSGCGGPENGGGGTGHPFGTGGQMFCGGNPSGLYGGGGGGGQQSTGGGGGYGTDGANGAGNNTVNTRGRIHGNAQGVPVAGGSGGASGNPQGLGACAGTGGGGGGAIAIYATDKITNLAALQAIGANGGGGSQTGGAGSGGYAALGSKIAASTGGTGNVSGGTGGGAGGRGRARYDGFTTTAPTFTNAGSTYIGPTMDTLTYSDSRKVTLNGTFDGASALRIYWKSDALAGGWQQAATAPTTNGRLWTLDITLPIGSVSGNYYFAAVQQTGANAGLYDAEPAWVFSQSAANIVKIDLIPKIKVPEAPVFPVGTLACIGDEEITTIRVINEGDALLNVNPSLGGANPGDYTILPPHNTAFSVSAGDTAYVRVRFAPATPGTRVANLVFANNDPRPGKNPTTVELRAILRRSEATISATDLDFGDVCVDSTSAPKQVEITYTGDIDDKLNGIPFVIGSQNAGDFVVTRPTSSELDLKAPTDNKTIVVRFTPTKAGIIDDSIAVSVGQCDVRLKFRVRGVGIDTRPVVTPASINFGAVVLNGSATQNFTIRNNGASPGTITQVVIRPPSAAVSITQNPAGQTLAPNASIDGVITFAPTTMDAYNGQICVTFGDVCPKEICIPINGTVVREQILVQPNQLTLVADTCLDQPPAVLKTFRLNNTGGVGLTILTATAKNSLVTITGGTGPLPAGQARDVNVLWQPGSSGTEEITLTTDASDPSLQTLKVTVTLLRDSSRIALIGKDGSNPAATVDFGIVTGCDVPAADTVFLRNLGSIDEIVQGDFILKSANNNAFTLTTPTPYTLAKGSVDLPVIILFDPATTGIYNDTLVLVSDRCRREVRVAVTATRVEPVYDTTGINFAQTNVGFPRTDGAGLKNGGSAPITVSEVFITPSTAPFVVSQSTLPATLNPGIETTVDVTFTPTAEQTYNAKLCFVISQPCPDTICVDLTGAGIQSNVLVEPNPLDFGRLQYCREDTLSLTIRNIGSGPVQLQQINMGGQDVGLFEQITSLSLPQTIAAGSATSIDFRFVPSRSATDGQKTATVLLVTDDARQSSINVILKGEIITPLVVTSALAFGQVTVGGFQEKTITVENRGNETISLSGIVGSPPFEVIPPIPTSLSPGERRDVTIRFTPTDSGSFSSRLFVYQDDPCPDTAATELRGSAKILLLGITEIAVPDTVPGSPGERVAIPIILKQSLNLAESEATTLRAIVRFDKTMLYARTARAKQETAAAKPVTGAAASVGRIISSTIDGADRVVTFELTNSPVPSSAPDTLGFLDVTVTLGSSLTTPVTFDTVFWADGNAIASARNGIFMLDGYCEVGGNRLVKVNGTFGIKSASPNPFNPSTEILFETVEDGATTLMIYDIYGRPVQTIVDGERLPVQAHIRTWDASGIPSGVYHAVLITPTQRSVYKLMLMK